MAIISGELVLRKILFFFLTAILVSCNPDVELCDVLGWENGVLTHSHRAMVRYSFEWESSLLHRPENVNVMWIRPVKRLKGFRVLPTDVVTKDTTFNGGE